jgi:hypothetical protein
MGEPAEFPRIPSKRLKATAVCSAVGAIVLKEVFSDVEL